MSWLCNSDKYVPNVACLSALHIHDCLFVIFLSFIYSGHYIDKSLCMDNIMCFRCLEFVINFRVKFNVLFGNLICPLVSHDLLLKNRCVWTTLCVSGP